MDAALRALFILAILGLVVAKPVDFVLPYEGKCTSTTSTYECRLISSSFLIDTQVLANGGVRTDFRKLTGTISELYIAGTFDTTKNPPEMKEQGNITFGIHSTRLNHVLNYEGGGKYSPECKNVPRIMCGATVNFVYGGIGVFQGASGYVTVNFGVLRELEDARALVTGVIFTPNAEDEEQVSALVTSVTN